MTPDNIRFIDGIAFRDSYQGPERRQRQTLERPARRSTDLSPAMQRFQQAAEAGEGLHRGRAVNRTSLSYVDLATITLAVGGHKKPEDGMCLMEAVAWFAGEKFSDHPKCVSPAIGAFGRSWNDSLDDAGRQRLKAYIPRLVGTATGTRDETTRAWMATDWLVRKFAPAWLRLAGLEAHAAALEGLEAITSAQLARKATPIIEEARGASEAAWSAAESAAWSAARSAAESAARSAAWSAAESAAWSAARSAAESAARSAAESAAWSAARSAAESAAWSAARSAAEKALAPTVALLQDSALELLDRMIEVGAAVPA